MCLLTHFWPVVYTYLLKYHIYHLYNLSEFVVIFCLPDLRDRNKYSRNDEKVYGLFECINTKQVTDRHLGIILAILFQSYKHYLKIFKRLFLFNVLKPYFHVFIKKMTRKRPWPLMWFIVILYSICLFVVMLEIMWLFHNTFSVQM